MEKDIFLVRWKTKREELKQSDVLIGWENISVAHKRFAETFKNYEGCPIYYQLLSKEVLLSLNLKPVELLGHDEVMSYKDKYLFERANNIDLALSFMEAFPSCMTTIGSRSTFIKLLEEKGWTIKPL